MLQREATIDVLFSDIVMPRGMNGVELAREARKLRPELRVLLSSGYANAVLAAEHGLTPDFSFIGKPYRWPDLAEKLRGGRVH
jgi:DNA-binding LytR/AlgR family response regulator